MSAKHALLGLLLDRSAYPYELADRLQQRLGPAWRVNSGQLYQTIKKLESEGLIERVEGAVRDRSARHVFSITEGGVAEYERWFDEVSGVRLARRPLLVKITFAGPERLLDALEKLDAYELECAERLRHVSHEREAIAVGGALVRADHVLLSLNLSADIFQLEGELRWVKQAREMISWLLSCQAVWPSTRERTDIASMEARDRHAAREELFSEMAARRLRSTSHEQGRRRDG
jgi:DNA-binding PadR family transcriptional regulator